MNKAYWNGKELRGPITLRKPDKENYWGRPHSTGMDSYDYGSYYRDVEKYDTHLASLPVLRSSGFEGMPVGEVEYVVEEQFWTGSSWWPTRHLIDGKVQLGTKTRTMYVPATPKASEVSGEKKPDVIKALVGLRNDLYEKIPTGEVKAWDLIQLIKWHINDIDNLCSKYEHPAPKHYPVWVKASERLPLIWSADELHYELDNRVVSVEKFSKDGVYYYDIYSKDYKTLLPEEFHRLKWLDDQPTPSIPIREAVDGSTCSLSDSELIIEVEKWVSKLAQSGGREWCLRIPADYNKDPDLLITEVCNRLKARS